MVGLNLRIFRTSLSLTRLLSAQKKKIGNHPHTPNRRIWALLLLVFFCLHKIIKQKGGG